jgi:A/G-specific adenine glycosylase
MSFAFGKRAAILDTNVARVLFRVFIGRGAARGHAMDRRLWEISRTVLPHRHVFDFNQALMDFGATLCSARKPKCLVCPMTARCRAYPSNRERC